MMERSIFSRVGMGTVLTILVCIGDIIMGRIGINIVLLRHQFLPWDMRLISLIWLGSRARMGEGGGWCGILMGML
jgi:hypothetical protein